MVKNLMFNMLTMGGIAFCQENTFSPAIEDNSFFIEEAYNQEKGVIQHISNGILTPGSSGEFFYAFTEEWPLWGVDHQISFTVPCTLSRLPGESGIGDILINYRYQLFGRDDWASIAPRFSFSLPAGDVGKGLSSGRIGYQLNVPASKRVSNAFVIHANLGMAVMPSAIGYTASGAQIDHTLFTYSAGLSAVALLTEEFNIMCEYLYSSAQTLDQAGNVVHTGQLLVSPGVRFAINVSDLQIVPGLGIPFTWANNEVTTGLFFYLSFEHPI